MKTVKIMASGSITSSCLDMAVFGHTMNMDHIIKDIPSRTERLVGKQVYYHPEEGSVIRRNVLFPNFWVLIGNNNMIRLI